jgi:uncharacterized protein
MRLSGFNLYVADCPVEGRTLVHNTFTGGFVTLPEEELAVLRAADAGQALSEAERAAIDPEYFDPAVGILVESREAEETAYRQWYEQQRRAVERLSAIVSVTFACNFACTYCCQSDVLDGHSMSPDTAKRTAHWLVERAGAIGARTIHLMFVGGEPLLQTARIEEIVHEVRASGLALTFGLITNGLFLTRRLVERWRPLGLVSAQVTLDGDETTHGITRRSKKRGEESFATIFRNVLAVAELITVKINGNYQRDTVHGFVPLVRELVRAGFPRGARIHFSPALTALGAPADSASGACSWSGSSPELMLALGDEVRRAGYDAGDPMSVGPCGFYRHHHYAIDPDGRLYKCPGFFGYEEWAIGAVSAGLNARYEELIRHEVQSDCGGCAHRPNCAGGCVAAVWRTRGRAEGVNCEQDFFEHLKAPLVQRKYALAVADSPEEAAAMVPPLQNAIPVAADRSRHRPAALRVLAA